MPGTVSNRPELLAVHYYAGGRFEPAWRYARRAGERANQRFAPAAAAESFARAAEAARRSPAVPEAERARDLEALGDAQFLCGRSAEADVAYHHAGRVLGAHAPSAPGLMLKLAKVAQRQGRYRLALRRLTLGLRELAGTDDAASMAPRARLLARRAVVLMSQGRYGAAQEAARDAVEVAGRAGEADALAQAHLVLHGVHVFSGTPDLGHHGDTALRLFEELGDLGGQAHALNNLAMRRLLQGQWTESLEMFERAAGMFQRVGDAANEANASYNQADLLNRQGRYAEAAARLDRVLHVARAVGDEELVGLVLREQGRALSRDGRAAGMGLLTAARDVFADLGEPHEVTDTDIALAEAHLMAGRPEAALEAVASAVEAARAIGAVTLLPSAYRVSAAALLELGDLPGARRSLDEGLRLGSSPDLAHERGFLLVVAARLAELAGSAERGHAGRGGPGRADLARRGPRAPALAARATGRPQRAGSRVAAADVVVEQHHAVEVAGAVALALHRVQARSLAGAEHALGGAVRRHVGERPGVRHVDEHVELRARRRSSTATCRRPARTSPARSSCRAGPRSRPSATPTARDQAGRRRLDAGEAGDDADAGPDGQQDGPVATVRQLAGSRTPAPRSWEPRSRGR